MQEILIFLLVVAFTAIQSYCLYIAGSKGFQKSISDSDYILTKPLKWIFEATLCFCGVILILVSLLYIGEPMWLLGASGLCFIGVAVFARFKLSKLYNCMHLGFAYVGFTLFSLAPWLCFGLWSYTATTVLAAIAVLMFVESSYKIWWLEIAIIYFGFFGLLASMLVAYPYL